MDSFWILLTAALVAANCALLGCFLVLRGQSMVGDAISHAILPGLFIAYWIAGSRAGLPLLVGAAAFGLLVTVLIEWLQKRAHLASDASLGLSFTTLFALGVVLISAYSGQVDLDQDCILYGEIAYVPLATDAWGIPQAVWQLFFLLFVVGIFLYLGYKSLFITTFDPQYAASLGIWVTFWHYALMGLVSLATVLSFESVGAILVVAFLVIPAASAYLLTDRLPVMLALSVVLGISAAILGYMLAIWLNGSIAGAMAGVAGAQFAMILPLSRWYAQHLAHHQ